jgi:hypothetical protein
MASWRLAPCLVVLRDEVDRKWPNRSTASDGTKGDDAHAARKSDHNPDSHGIVHAIDITTLDNRQGRRIRRVIKRACIRDKRVWYVIANGYIFSQTHNWKRQKYTGINAHKAHIHISANYANGLANSTAAWGIGNIFRRLFNVIRNRVRK